MSAFEPTSPEAQAAAERTAGQPRPGEFAGKTVLITGAASGQGRGVARAFAAQGASVIGFDREAPLAYPSYLDHADDELDALAAELGPERFLAARGDVRDLTSLEAAVTAGVERFGGLDTVFANAGICAYGLSHELTDREWSDMIGINLTGVWHTTRAATPALIARGGGVIVTNSSIGGLRGMRRLSHYAADKWGVIGLTKSLAIELAPHNVRAVSIHPTGVDTQMNDGLAAMEGKSPQEIAEASAGNLLPVPWIETSDVAELVLFLARPRPLRHRLPARAGRGTAHRLNGTARARQTPERARRAARPRQPLSALQRRATQQSQAG